MATVIKGRFEEKKFQDALKKLEDFKPDQPGRGLLFKITRDDIAKNRRKGFKVVK